MGADQRRRRLQVHTYMQAGRFSTIRQKRVSVSFVPARGSVLGELDGKRFRSRRV